MHVSKTKTGLAMLRAGIGEQKVLAEKAGLHPNTVSNIMRGASAKAETVGKLAKALNIDPAELIEQEAQQ